MAVTSVSGREQRGKNVSDPMAGEGAIELDGIIDSLIAWAPLLVRQRLLLPAFDWSKASAQQIGRLAERLAEADMVVPVGIARDILVSGHALAESVMPALASELQMLNRLNGLPSGSAGEDVVRGVSELATTAPPSGEVAIALVRRLMELGAQEEACKVALAAWPTTPRALHHAREAVAPRLRAMPALKCAVAGFSTTSTFVKALVPAFAKRGIRIETDEAPFGSAIAALHGPSTDTQACLLLLDSQSLLASSWRKGLNAAARDLTVRLEALEQAIERFSGDHGLPLVINTLPAATEPQVGYMDGYHEAGLAALTRRSNDALGALAARLPNLSLVDTDVALARVPFGERYDPRMWYYGRIAYAEPAVNEIAEACATAWAMREARPIKVVALDFDNTLWGGVFGDDGIDRLQCGDDPPGNAFKALQEECLRLKAQGKLLVALSKNNPDVMSVFEQHPGMALRADDFAAKAVNWQPKPENIRQIAAELNLGLDSFLFLDDSPHEREAMRQLCPQVRVPELPTDPAARPRWLRGLAETWPSRLTAEDMERPAMYLAESKARELKATATSYDEYLHGLEQRLVIEPLTGRTLPRVAQLHERTNQFNPTTQRYTQVDLSGFMNDATNFVVLHGTAEDRFGKHGLVIAAVARLDGKTAYIDSLVMSCRVIARQIETAFLGALIEKLCERGISEVVASYRPTAKNELVRDLYAGHGFAPCGSHDPEVSNWIWKAKEQRVPVSPFVTVEWSL